MQKIKVAIVGASGFTGLELIKILIGHPGFELVYVANSEGEMSLSELHPALAGIFDIKIEKADAKEITKCADLAFLALPHKTAMGFAKELLELGIKVVDLSADYRLELETYEKYYCNHQDKEHLQEAVYGLPEFFRDDIKKTNLVANPGCYPTATLLGILPFCKYLDENYPIFVDAKSGVSGAGKKCNEKTHFVSIDENVFAYNPLKHRHEPEIKEKMRIVSKGVEFDVNFVPHLLPLIRGEMCDIYCRLKKDINPLEYLKEFYKDEKFVRVFDKPVQMKAVAGTNFCDIFVQKSGSNLYICSTIDNILKGSSSAAVVNANIMSGFEEEMGIPIIAYVP